MIKENIIQKDNIENILELTPEEIFLFQNEILEILKDINSSDIQNEKYDKLIRGKNLDKIFQVIFGYSMEINRENLLKLQSYLYIINRDEYQNIDYKTIRRVSTNKLVLRGEDGSKLGGYLHTDHTVHIIPGQTSTLNKNGKSYTLQKIVYIDIKSQQKKEAFVAEDFLNSLDGNDLVGLNGYLIENQISHSLENKKSIYNKVKHKFNNQDYNPEIIKHNQAIYTYLVEKKIETNLKNKLTTNQTQESVLEHKNSIKVEKEITSAEIIDTTPVQIHNTVLPFMETNEECNTNIQSTLISIKSKIDNIFGKNIDGVRKIEYQQGIELGSKQEVIIQLNKQLIKLVNGRNPKMFHTNILDIDDNDNTEIIIQKTIKYLYKIGITTISILNGTINDNSSELMNQYEEDNSNYLKRVYGNQRTGSEENTKYKGLLIKWLLEK